ncbi:unnamed protein product, partial [Ectocarpus fasciculatus]
MPLAECRSEALHRRSSGGQFARARQEGKLPSQRRQDPAGLRGHRERDGLPAGHPLPVVGRPGQADAHQDAFARDGELDAELQDHRGVGPQQGDPGGGVEVPRQRARALHRGGEVVHRRDLRHFGGGGD